MDFKLNKLYLIEKVRDYKNFVLGKPIFGFLVLTCFETKQLYQGCLSRYLNKLIDLLSSLFTPLIVSDV